MNAPLPAPSRGITRGGFLVGTGAGLAAGVPLTWLGLKGLDALDRETRATRSFTGRSVEDPHSRYAMPGPYPGRVIEVHHRGAVKTDHTVDSAAVKRMIDRGMR